MVQPRAARRRVVASSSDEDSEADADHEQQNTSKTSSTCSADFGVRHAQNQIQIPHRSRLRPPTPISSQVTTASPIPTPEATPKKRRTKGALKDINKKSNVKTLYSFFNNATQKLQRKAQSPETQLQDAGVDPGDAIQDDSDLDSKRNRQNLRSTSTIPRMNKRLFEMVDNTTVNTAPPSSMTPLPSQKFLKAADGSRVVRSPAQNPDSSPSGLRPWAEEYAPCTLEELVIHKKKVSDVRDWLLAAFAGQKYKKLLVLKGPAGSGKTITISMLAKSMGFQVVEWKNPVSSDFSSEDYTSISSQFDDFLGRGRQFGSLDLTNTDGVVQSSITQTTEIPISDKQINLIEEFPYTLLRATSALQYFRSTLLQCLAADTRPSERERKIIPIVLIISESHLSSNSNSSENLTAHRLLGPEVLHHPSTMLIEFNSVAPTFISKALSLVLQKHRKQTGIAISPTQDIMKRISDIGDVRNAVATLEFISAHSGTVVNRPSIPVKSRSRISRVKSTTQTNSLEPGGSTSLVLIGLRESTIGLFHAIGKVVYNKRSTPVDDSGGPTTSIVSDESQLPPHLSHYSRAIPSEVDVAALIDETGTDTSTFLSGLHENYALSCSDPSGDSETTLDILNACLDTLGDADILLNPVFASRSGVNEGLRQEEIAFETGVRGLLFNLPHPVKRQPHPSKSKADAHRMFYPTGLKIWRKKEEILGLLNFFVQKAMDGSLLGGVRLNKPQNGIYTESQPGSITTATRSGVDRWRRTRPNGFEIAENANDEATSHPYLAIGSGQSARHEMLLERLPYLARVLIGASSPLSQGFQKQVEQVTRYTGIGGLQDDEEEDGSLAAMSGTTAFKGASRTTTGFSHTDKFGMDEELDVKALVLSDDDIEDD